ncbi:phage adaptor protein [Methylobacterium sp. JK268]
MPTPQGAPTLGDLVAEIEDDIARADLNAQVRTAIVRAIRHHQSERFGFNERVLTFQAVQGVDTYGAGDLPDIATLLAIDTLVVVQSDQVWALQRRPERAIESVQQANFQGWPCFYSYLDRSIRIDPVPDATYTLRLTGHVRIPPPGADDETSPWVDEAGTLIAAWAKRHLALNALRDPQMAAMQQTAAAEALTELRGRANRAASSGVIRAHDL